MSKTDKKSTSKPASQETPKVINLEVSKLISETYASLGRFTKLMDGLNTFCMHVDDDGPERDFAFAVATIADLIKRDVENIRAKLGEITLGGSQ